MASTLNNLSRRGFIKGAAGSATTMAVLGNSAHGTTASSDTYKLTREIPVERGWDVVVCGGGAFRSSGCDLRGAAWREGSAD